MPVTLTSRTLKANELSYGTVEKKYSGSSPDTGHVLYRAGHTIDQGADAIPHAGVTGAIVGPAGPAGQLVSIAFNVNTGDHQVHARK